MELIQMPGIPGPGLRVAWRPLPLSGNDVAGPGNQTRVVGVYGQLVGLRLPCNKNPDAPVGRV
jgi:hypothetical protein